MIDEEGREGKGRKGEEEEIHIEKGGERGEGKEEGREDEEREREKREELT